MTERGCRANQGCSSPAPPGGSVARWRRCLHHEGYDLLATDIVDAGEVPYRFEQADLLDHVARARTARRHRRGVAPREPPRYRCHSTAARLQRQRVDEREHVPGCGRARCRQDRLRQHAATHRLPHRSSDRDQRAVASPAYPLDETTAPDPSNVYALSKTVSEVMLRYYAERCGIDCVALRFPLLHHSEDRVRVSPRRGATATTSSKDSPVSRTRMRPDLFLAVMRTDLPGYRVYMPGAAHRHRDLALAELIRAHYPDVPDHHDRISSTSPPSSRRPVGGRARPGLVRPFVAAAIGQPRRNQHHGTAHHHRRRPGHPHPARQRSTRRREGA